MQSVALMTLALLSKPLLSPVVKGTSNCWGPTHNWTKLWAMRGHYTCPVLIWVPEFYIGNYLRAVRGRGRVSRRCPAATRASRLQEVNLPNWAEATAAVVLFLVWHVPAFRDGRPDANPQCQYFTMWEIQSWGSRLVSAVPSPTPAVSVSMWLFQNHNELLPVCVFHGFLHGPVPDLVAGLSPFFLLGGMNGITD